MAVAMVAMCVALSSVGVASLSDAGAQTYAWFLSGSVMPVPPYGSVDIPGSDVASKLIVNLPSGVINATITGVMGGLAPSTTYTVYIAKPYVSTWDVSGSYVINVEYLGVNYPENAVLTQSGTAITGTSLGGGPYPMFSIIDGSVIGNHIHVVMTLGGLKTELDGTIAPDGTMSGTWMDTAGGSRTGTWATASGIANHKGSYPGLYTSAVQPFTFTTDDTGSGSWHVNIRNKDIIGQNLGSVASVWINGAGATMLISENFQI